MGKIWKRKSCNFYYGLLLKLKMFLVAIWSQFFAPYSDIHSYFPFDHDVENPIIDFFSLSDFLVFKEINLTKIGFDILIVKRKILYFLKKLLQLRGFFVSILHIGHMHIFKIEFSFFKNSSYWNSGIYSMAFATDILLTEMQFCQGSLI